MVFDPDQDPEEKRAVRQNYRSLTRKIEGMWLRRFYDLHQLITFQEQQANPNDYTTEELLQQVRQADKLFGKGMHQNGGGGVLPFSVTLKHTY